MSQLKCEPPNPYLDDYYYTARQEVRHAEDNRDGPQLVRNNIEHEQQGSDYIPKQFKNSLGKLQVRKVSPPRHFYIKKIKIIKVKKNSTFDLINLDNNKQKKAYKNLRVGAVTEKPPSYKDILRL